MGSGVRKMCKTKEPLMSPPDANGVGKGDGNQEEEEEDKALLSPLEDGEGGVVDEEDNGMVKRKVQWNDYKGNKLVEVLEFEPSEASDSDNDDAFDSCICSVM